MGKLRGTPEDHDEASYYGKRAPIDGVIDWSRPAAKIDRLIKAVSDPLPGARTYWEDTAITLWASRMEVEFKGIGTSDYQLPPIGGSE